jgi:hypothetical protein
MGSPKEPKLEVDPNLQANQAAAQKTLVDQLQVQAQGDTASMMARYGTRLALSGSGMTPADAAAPAAPAISSTSWYTPLLNPITQPAGTT